MVYEFTRRTDGVGNIAYAAHVNELQQAIEAMAAISAGEYERKSGNSYYSSLLVCGTSFGLTANTLYAAPFPVGHSGITIDQVATRVTFADGTAARIGAYTHDPVSYLPSELIADFGTVSTTSTGEKTISVADLPISGEHPDYLVWFAVVCDSGAPNLAAYNSTSPNRLALGVGLSGSQVNSYSGVSRAFTYAALPDPFGGTPTPSLLTPAVHVRMS